MNKHKKECTCTFCSHMLLYFTSVIKLISGGFVFLCRHVGVWGMALMCSCPFTGCP